MATFRQITAATAALGMSWPRIVEVCARDLGEHGVLTDADLRRLERPAGYRVGDVVAMRGRGRYRAARVWKVPRRSRRVSALYLTPTSLAEDRVGAPALCNITATPLGLITATTTGDTRPRPAHPPRRRASPDREQAGPAHPGLGCPPAVAAAANTNTATTRTPTHRGEQ